jgi:hypothetical protein
MYCALKLRTRHAERSEESHFDCQSKRDSSARSVPRNNKFLTFAQNAESRGLDSETGLGPLQLLE